jgi:hypothetical protein
LQAIMGHKRPLNRVQLISINQTRRGDDLRAILRHRERQAANRPTPIEQHGASTALAMVTPLLRWHDAKVLTERIEQRHPGIHRQRPRLAIDQQSYCNVHRPTFPDHSPSGQ